MPNLVVCRAPADATPWCDVSVFSGASGLGDVMDGPRQMAQHAAPHGAALLTDGTVVVADAGGHCIRAINVTSGARLFSRP
jgi:hypothetical protein